MTDRELLGLAAKAAGITDGAHCELVGGDPALYSKHANLGIWAPLIDDGDALRLAVKLGLDVVFDPEGARVYKGSMFWREESPDREAATRRVIVRAAAKIGRSQP